MDRNAVTAIILITLIMVVWMWVFAPAPPEPPPTADPELAEQIEDQLPEPPPAATEREEDLLVDPTLEAPTEGEERLITVETDLYTAQFSTRGATLVSFVLKDYKKFDQETPVQLIDTTRKGAISMVFMTPANHIIDTRSLYYNVVGTEDDVIELAAGTDQLVFETAIGEGRIRKMYTFVPGEYEITLALEQENPESFSTQAGYELVWNGGVPFTEGDPEDEARFTGAFTRLGGVVENITLQARPHEERRLIGDVDWAAVKNKFFAAVVMPDQPTTGAELDGERFDAINGTPAFETYSARLLMPRSATGVDTYRMYIGPMEYYRISGYGLGIYDMVDFGWSFFDWMTRPIAKYVIIPSFHFLSQFIPNYGVVIIIFAILVKIILYPLTKSSFTNIARMRELQPKMEAIKEKFANDPQKQQQAMLKMYKDTGVNPLGGCLPLLLQWPIIIALWQFFPSSIELRQQSFLWARDLSAPDAIINLPFTIPLYGGFIAGFCLLMGISMVIQMRLQTPPATQAPQMKMMMYIFPVMIFFIFNRLAAGLNLYYLLYNVLTAAQQKWINHTLEKKGITTKPEAKKTPSTNGQPKSGGRKRLPSEKAKSAKAGNKRAKTR